MADGVFNIAKGKLRYYCELPATSDALVVVLLKATGLQSDDALADYSDLAALLAATNDEATFTNYVRKTVTAVTITQDNVNNRVDFDIADQTWTAAGGAVNDSLGKLLVCYDPDTTTGTDSTVVPLTFHDFVVTTSGADLTAVVFASGFSRAA